VNITVLSDTHGQHGDITVPTGDMVIHCGDISPVGTVAEINSFLEWFSGLPHRFKVFCAGNHDFLYEQNGVLAKSMIPSNVIYLEDNLTEIEGIKIYGTPVSPPFCNWAFNREPERIIRYWQNIPTGVDILVTHCPPYGILDWVNYEGDGVGCPLLRKELERIRPRYHCFGHIHEQYGQKDINGTTYINASVLNGDYQIQNKCVEIDY
jgi:Icc-related predicted phosphoesterase